MLDIKFIRDNQDAVKDAIEKKCVDLDLNLLLSTDDDRLTILKQVEDLRAEKNANAAEMKNNPNDREALITKGKDLKEKTSKLEIKLDELDSKYNELMMKVPNVFDIGTPVGPDDSHNKELKKVGTPTDFSFEPKDHVELAKILDIVEFDAGVNLHGFRGYYLKNEGVRLQIALMQLAMDQIQERGYDLYIPPVTIRGFALEGSGHFPSGKEEVFRIGNAARFNEEDTHEPMYLAGTSEPSLLALYADKTLTEDDLPIKVCGYSPSYRSEIGSYGKDTKGLYRVQEFMKVEQVSFCPADLDAGLKMFDEMLENATSILDLLELPYRIVANSTGDMGSGKYKMYDIETWMPSRDGYGETHSCSYLTDWQARRLNIRYKDKDGKSKFVHTLNNTALASPRFLIPILENFQQADGSIKLPKALAKYTGFEVIKPKK